MKLLIAIVKFMVIIEITKNSNKKEVQFNEPHFFTYFLQKKVCHLVSFFVSSFSNIIV